MFFYDILGYAARVYDTDEYVLELVRKRPKKKEENQSEVRLDGPGLARFSLVSGPVIGMERVGVAVLRILEMY